MLEDFLFHTYGIDIALQRRCGRIEEDLAGAFSEIDRIRDYNQLKILNAMQKAGVAERHFSGTAGYGYDDIGRDIIEEVYARTFNTDDAIVRSQIISGTQCLTIALFGILRPGDEVVSATGKPYDTLDSVIGIRPGHGSLAEFGVIYKQVELKTDGSPDLERILQAITSKTKMVMIQRSRGYSCRPAISLEDIAEISLTVKKKNPAAVVFTDNCYGEFVDYKEPVNVGADIMAGSLIKNPGGGLALNGGYIVGRKELIELCADRATAPGLGKHVGASINSNRSILQGFYMAPHIVSEALKGAIFTSALLEELGFRAAPSKSDKRSDIVQTICFKDPEKLKIFCRAVQKAAPVDSFVVPEAWDMPGYDSQVIMAAGAFVQGASIELSADGPMRYPYTAYMQGGLTYINVKLAAMIAASNLIKN